MGVRRKSREYVLQMLFQAEMGKQSPENVQHTFWQQRGQVDEEARGFAEDLFRVATERGGEIDGIIEKHTQHWRLDRMAAIDRNILRTAVAEFVGYPETAKAIVINEALEIARKFSSPNALQFINGVLDSIAKEMDSAAAERAPARRR